MTRDRSQLLNLQPHEFAGRMRAAGDEIAWEIMRDPRATPAAAAAAKRHLLRVDHDVDLLTYDELVVLDALISRCHGEDVQVPWPRTCSRCECLSDDAIQRARPTTNG